MSNVQFKLETINDWIQDHLKNPICSICGGNAWEFSDKLWQLIEYSESKVLRIGGDSAMGRTALVLVLLICRNCKQVHFFNAIAIAMQKQMDDAAIAAATEGMPER